MLIIYYYYLGLIYVSRVYLFSTYHNGGEILIKMDKINKTMQDMMYKKHVCTKLKDKLNTFMVMHSDNYKKGLSPYYFKRRLGKIQKRSLDYVINHS